MSNRKTESQKDSWRNLLMRLILILVFAHAPFISLSREIDPFGRNYSDTIPSSFKLNVYKLRDHIYSQIPADIRNNKYKREAFFFADQYANNISELIASGKLYSDWNSLEEYLNEILRKVIPPELKNDSTIHVYVLRDGNFNAAMTASGHFFVNVGIFSDVTDEATIAGVFAHELAHYYLKHSLYTYIESVKGTFNPGVFYRNRSFSKYSVKNELQADSLGIVWLYKSGYNLNGLFYAFNIMKRIEKNEIRRLKNKWELEETTHPTSDKRSSQFVEFVQTHPNNGGGSFLVDEQKFRSFRKQAKPEILNLQLRNNNYNKCLETAFRFHLFEPDNPVYIYYMLESIRRSCYLNSNLWSKLFITNHYYQDVDKSSGKNKPEVTDNLFTKFDPDIIALSPGEQSEIKAKFYWENKPKFTTYEEAFNFYYRVSQRIGCTECILTNALSFTKQDSLRNHFMQEYLNHDSILHREYAKSMLEGTIYKNLADQKLVGFDNMDITIRQGEDDIRIFNKTPESKTVINTIVDSIMVDQKNKKPIFMDAFKFNHLNDYNLLLQLESFSLLYTVGIGEKTELHILNPDYWEFFNRYKVNEIEFVQARYFEFYGSESSLDAYRQVSDQEFDSVLCQKKCTRYIYPFISSLRDIPKGVMKVRRAGNENKLAFKGIGSQEIISSLREEMKQKDKLAADLDSGYKKNYYVLMH